MIGDLFSPLPIWAQVLFWVVLGIIVCSLISIVTLLAAAGRFAALTRRRERDALARRPEGAPPDESRFLWVFVVPALNEEVTIADSIARLRATNATDAVFLVIDDGSTDATGEILASIDDPRLSVLTRTPPDARQGKAAALNAGYRHVREHLLTQPRYASFTADRVIIVVVDADGRLDANAPDAAARQFADGGVGGVQTLVRIYNRRGWLTWAQDVEFSSFGLVYQAGRSWWGTANMGGNGQFTRLAALESVDAGEGPWRDRLTEDQDLGVRMIQAGWASVHVNDVSVDQQGLNSVRRLYRQRVRWAQGAWQAFSLLGGVARPRLPLPARVDAVWYLLTPALQLLTGVAFVTSIVLALAEGFTYRPTHWWVLVFFIGLSFGPGVASLALRGRRWWSPFAALVLVIPYTLYSWVVFPVLAVALIRQAAGRTSWAKTARESTGPATDGSAGAASEHAAPAASARVGDTE
ncbi:glycosyltransferase [Microbacterium sp. LRZ72]|uniref:glycosyltransferase family 2 protein n=1 Tax=Microbacterium sp. LRZ72 TaxID=2942481 RepID=UPI0029A0E2B5|nr:glycosyltransferase family 2 protein [Microbacterium sp. LRZ72]MDX2375818.1 glycosyltransferase [Microbacterium sp. LRZ72]